MNKLHSERLKRALIAMTHPKLVEDRVRRAASFYFGTVDEEKIASFINGARSAMVLHDWTAREYFEYGYANLTCKERSHFVTLYQYHAFVKEVQDEKAISLLADKWSCYQFLKDFYGRKAVMLPVGEEPPESLYERFQQFIGQCSKHRFFLKPLSKEGGNGICRIDSGDYATFEAFMNVLQQYSSRIIVEEEICQAESLAHFHPQSVNSIRMHTIRFNDGVHAFMPYLKLGCGSAIVDNAHSGGIKAILDMETGVVTSMRDVMNRTYSVHPDTKSSAVGFQVPRWQELIDLTKQLHTRFDRIRLVGWDMALTDEGWIVVEANSDPGIYALQRDFYDEFCWIKNKYRSESKC